MKASAAKPFASSAEPALKPNQPNHSSEAPIMVIVRLCGAMDSLPRPMRLPSMKAPIKPATPALMCTTVPPAKSSAPHCQIRPAVGIGGVHDIGRGVGIRPRPEPHHVRDRAVAEREPQHQEQQHRREFRALDDRAQNQTAGDRRESRLEGDEHQLVHRRALAEGGAEREFAGGRIESAIEEQPARSRR